ncbi:MAG: T9SS type A sorting domain-containing protein [Saprospiraceae bacterium]|nr:T9SS type A sorting domain-containing protein [Saprospiraceae bacterium]
MPTFPKFISLLPLVCLFISMKMEGQSGCTDMLALNFDPIASQNDGSCEYPETTYFPTQTTTLPSNITEASGAAFFNGQLWLHQDGGVSPTLHTVDTLTGTVLQTLPLPSIQNTDWEDLAEDETHLYIGDFGNNLGTRTDLRIYKISKNDLLADTATAEVIEFAFSDQTDFTPANQAHNFDCEAFIALGDSLHLFSKRWLDMKTHHYVLPKTAGTYLAHLRDSLEVGFLTSAADIAEDGTLVLLGYEPNSATSLWMLWDYPGTRFFAGNKRQIRLGNALNMSQAEGIAFSSNSTGFICTEQLSILPARLLRFEIGQWLSGPSAVEGPNQGPEILVSPNPFSGFFDVDFQGVAEQNASLELLSSDGRPLLSSPLRSGENRVETAGLSAGNYLLLLKNGAEIRVQKIVKR